MLRLCYAYVTGRLSKTLGKMDFVTTLRLATPKHTPSLSPTFFVLFLLLLLVLSTLTNLAPNRTVPHHAHNPEPNRTKSEVRFLLSSTAAILALPKIFALAEPLRLPKQCRNFVQSLTAREWQSTATNGT
jgi:hypothetical protein